MKARNIGYWVTTGLTALAMGTGGVLDVLGAPDILATMAHLGYPAYVATLIGVWKILGTAAILAPGFPRLKEWAYAGVMLDLTGAAVSHAAVGDGAGAVLTPLVLLAFMFGSWALRPDSRKLRAADKTPESARDMKGAVLAT